MVAFRRFGLIGIGIITGFINGLLGIGGGSFLVPMLIYLFKMKEHHAHGTSLATILPTSVVSVIVYASKELVDYPLALAAAVGGSVGAYAGAKLMKRLSAKYLRRTFALFMAAAALRMLLAGVFS